MSNFFLWILPVELCDCNNSTCFSTCGVKTGITVWLCRCGRVCWLRVSAAASCGEDSGVSRLCVWRDVLRVKVSPTGETFMTFSDVRGSLTCPECFHSPDVQKPLASYV